MTPAAGGPATASHWDQTTSKKYNLPDLSPSTLPKNLKLLRNSQAAQRKSTNWLKPIYDNDTCHNDSGAAPLGSPSLSPALMTVNN